MDFPGEKAFALCWGSEDGAVVGNVEWKNHSLVDVIAGAPRCT